MLRINVFKRAISGNNFTGMLQLHGLITQLVQHYSQDKFATTDNVALVDENVKLSESVTQSSIVLPENEGYRLTKKELTSKLSIATGIHGRDVINVLDALSKLVETEVLGKGRQIRLPKLGQFKQRVYRKRNKETNEMEVVKGKKSISFKASDILNTEKRQRKRNIFIDNSSTEEV